MTLFHCSLTFAFCLFYLFYRAAMLPWGTDLNTARSNQNELGGPYTDEDTTPAYDGNSHSEH